MRLHRSPTRDAISLARIGVVYWLQLAPAAKRELRYWRRRAQAVPDTQLRAASLAKHSDEALNSEAAALFAILAPRRSRALLVELIVAYQVMYDYLDAVNEEPVGAQLLDGRHLHQALVDAVQPARRRFDYYTHHPRQHDAGYLTTLVKVCNTSLGRLPSTAAVGRLLAVAAERCGEAQARNHAVGAAGDGQLADWSKAQTSDGGYYWWELAAAGISCLAIHALLTVAATPRKTETDAERVDAAYFPSICAISALLDSVVDRPTDITTGNHSFAAHYTTMRLATVRCEAIIAIAREEVEVLPNGRLHRMLLAGIVAYYISGTAVDDEASKRLASDARSLLGAVMKPMLSVMRVRRRQHSRSRRTAAGAVR